MDERKRKFLELIKDNAEAEQLVDEILFLEDQMKELKKLPFIVVNPKNRNQQKATPASKQYKEMLQQYNNSLRLLYRLSGEIGGEAEEESPLRKWVRERANNADQRKENLDA